MNRDHKYRGLTKEGKWVYGYLFQIWDEVYILWGTTNGVPNMTEVIPSTVGEFTGKKDSKGRDIYEGDQQRWLNPIKSKEEYAKDPYSYCVVKWSQLNAAFNMYLGDDCEVISNIHQPEGE